jgi:hypothetical protein
MSQLNVTQTRTLRLVSSYSFFLPVFVEQLLIVYIAQDETDAIDEDNIIDDRTRGAKPKADYTEKEEDDLPREALESGTSST